MLGLFCDDKCYSACFNEHNSFSFITEYYTGSNLKELHQKQPTGALKEVTMTVDKIWPTCSMRRCGCGESLKNHV